MRYLPLDAVDREVMLARIGAPTSRRCSPTFPPTSGSRGCSTCRARMSEMAVERKMAAMAGRSRRGGLGSVLPRRRRL